MHAIRRARPSDAVALALMAEETFRDTFAADNSAANMDLHCSQSYGPDLQLREIVDQNLVTLVAEQGGELTAFAQVRLHAPQECVGAADSSELYRLYVLKRWHGLGVAQNILRQALATATSAGNSQIWLGVWERNARAQAFYRKHGFVLVGDQIYKVGNDPQRDLVMVAELGAHSAA